METETNAARQTKQIQMNTMCVCISLSAYVTLFCLFSPKLSIILLHPDKNVRKLTMNSATYKRPFKPVSSFASADGRNNLAGPGNQGGLYSNYGGAHTDGGSGGPMSTTSNVLNLGESSDDRQHTICNCFGFSCSHRRTEAKDGGIDQPAGPGKVNAASLWQSLSIACCWLAIRRYLSQCCSLGEVGPTSFELDSHTDNTALE